MKPNPSENLPIEDNEQILTKKQEIVDPDTYVDPYLQKMRDRQTPEIAEKLDYHKTKEDLNDQEKIEQYIDPVLQKMREKEMLEKTDLVKKTTKSIRNSLAASIAKDSSISPGDAYPTKENTIWKKPTPEVSKKESLWQKIKNFGKTSAVAGTAALAVGTASAGVEKMPTDSTGGPTKEKVIKAENSLEVSSRLRQDWNDYVDWLGSIKMKGSEALDHNGLGIAMIERYRKEHPETSLSPEKIEVIQREFLKYREWALAEIQAGRGRFAPGVTAENFMSHVSNVDQIPGHLTTQIKFAHEYEVSLEGDVLDYTKIGNTVILKKDVEGKITGITKKSNRVSKIDNKGFATQDTSGDQNNLAKK